MTRASVENGSRLATRRQKSKMPVVPELAIHRAVVNVLERALLPGVAWTHFPSGEMRPAGVGGKLKGMGVKAGWPDFLIVKDGRLYGLELKTTNGQTTSSQELAHFQMRRAGAEVAVAYGLDRALECLAGWGVIRASSTFSALTAMATSGDEPPND